MAHVRVDARAAGIFEFADDTAETQGFSVHQHSAERDRTKATPSCTRDGGESRRCRLLADLWPWNGASVDTGSANGAVCT